MYESIVKKAEIEYLRNQEEINRQKYQEKKSTPSLWPSSLFSCHRKTAYQILGEKPTLQFSDDSLNYMNGGVVLEDATGNALEYMYDAVQSVTLKNDMWSGKADFVINHLKPNAIIVEHKATGENKFADDKQLPKKEHISQLALYGKLYKELFDIDAKLVLYYKGWGCWAEFELDVHPVYIQVTGMVSNFKSNIFVSKRMRINVQEEIDKLERVYETVLGGGNLPMRLDKKYLGCEFMGTPSCSYYYSCWGK